MTESYVGSGCSNGRRKPKIASEAFIRVRVRVRDRKRKIVSEACRDCVVCGLGLGLGLGPVGTVLYVDGWC